MFNDNFIEYLNENLGRIFLNEMKKYVQLLQSKGLNEKKFRFYLFLVKL